METLCKDMEEFTFTHFRTFFLTLFIHSSCTFHTMCKNISKYISNVIFLLGDNGGKILSPLSITPACATDLASTSPSALSSSSVDGRNLFQGQELQEQDLIEGGPESLLQCSRDGPDESGNETRLKEQESQESKENQVAKKLSGISVSSFSYGCMVVFVDDPLWGDPESPLGPGLSVSVWTYNSNS